jgi:Domain of unknown function (DUF4126)
MLEIVLATLSVAAAAGMRSMLPLLVLGCLAGEGLWSKVPILEHVSPQILVGILVTGSLFEVIASKDRLGIRVSQLFQLCLSPLVGGLLGFSVARATDLPMVVVVVLGLVSGLLALVLQLVQVGWFYRLRGLPLWMVFAQDFLCVLLIMFAFGSPHHGGVLALLLLWFAIRSASEWQTWYQGSSRSRLTRSLDKSQT